MSKLADSPATEKVLSRTAASSSPGPGPGPGLGLCMEMADDWLMLLPKGFLIDMVSRLSAKDACILKVTAKPCLSLISEFQKLRTRSPLLVFANAIYYYKGQGLSIVEDTSPSVCKVVFNFNFRLDYAIEFVASCRDLLCFYNRRDLYLYSPSTNQYLPFKTSPPYSDVETHTERFALVYVASTKTYKIVKFEIHGDPYSLVHPPTIRSEAITLYVEDEAGNHNYCHEPRTCSWEFISEHAMPCSIHGRLHNLIGVDGVVYTIIGFAQGYQRKVLSLGFDGEQQHKFKMFNLPQVASHRGIHCPLTSRLSQVKDLLCYPHLTTSCIDLWLLKDRNTCTWFKGYTINLIPPPHEALQQLAYFPQPTDADAGAGLFIFGFGRGRQVFRYDTATEKSTYLFKYPYYQYIFSFSNNLYPLKNGLTCTRIDSKGKAMMQHPPPINHKLYHKPLPPGGCRTPDSLPPPPPSYYPPNLQHISCSLGLKTRKPHHPLPQGSGPPPPYKAHEIRTQWFNMRMPHPQPSPPPPPQSSPPQPPYDLHSLLPTAYQMKSLPPLHKALPPPPPPPSFDSDHFRDNIQSPEVKRRKTTF